VGDDIFDADFRSLTTEHQKMMFLYPGSVGFSTKGATRPGAHTGEKFPSAPHYVKILDSKGIELNSKQSFLIEANGHIRVKGKRVVLKGTEYTYLGRTRYRPETDGEALARIGMYERLPANFPRQLVPDPKAELFLRYNAETGAGAIAIGAQDALFAGWRSLSYALYNDGPVEGVFDWGGFLGNIGAGALIAAVAGAVVVATGGFGLVAAGPLTVAIMGGSVALGGLMLVGVKAYGDYKRGAVSAWSEYAGAAIKGGGTVLIFSVAGHVAGAAFTVLLGNGVVPRLLAGATGGFTASITTQAVFEGEIIVNDINNCA
jgi:hypothetical protein